MTFRIVNEDITNMDVDAIVNAANTDLAMGAGVCGAIFRSAGIKELTMACRRLSPIKTGQAVITAGFDAKAKYIIHTAGPIYDKDNPSISENLLKKSYSNSLNLAKDKHIKSMAFPLISSGIYGYPKEEAFKLAYETINTFLDQGNDIDVYLTIFDKKFFDKLSKTL